MHPPIRTQNTINPLITTQNTKSPASTTQNTISPPVITQNTRCPPIGQRMQQAPTNHNVEGSLGHSPGRTEVETTAVRVTGHQFLTGTLLPLWQGFTHTTS